MSMYITYETYLHSIFYAGNGKVNWIAWVFREGNQSWRVRYRFYDKKSKKRDWTDVIRKNNQELTRDEAITIADHLGTHLMEKMPFPFLERIPVLGGPNEYRRAMEHWDHEKLVEVKVSKAS